MAQLAEQLICNQQVIGSIPIVGSMDGFPSGQRGQTVNLLHICFGGSNPPPSTCNTNHSGLLLHCNDAGWSSLEARRAHNPKVIGSNPIPAT